MYVRRILCPSQRAAASADKVIILESVDASNTVSLSEEYYHVKHSKLIVHLELSLLFHYKQDSYVVWLGLSCTACAGVRLAPLDPAPFYLPFYSNVA